MFRVVLLMKICITQNHSQGGAVDQSALATLRIAPFALVGRMQGDYSCTPIEDSAAPLHERVAC